MSGSSKLFTQLRNATFAHHSYFLANYNQFNLQVLQALTRAGYISGFKTRRAKNIFRKKIQIALRYTGFWVKVPIISEVKQISKSGQRLYCTFRNLKKKVLKQKYNSGLTLLSTSHGVLSDVQARKLKVGGEVLCHIN